MQRIVKLCLATVLLAGTAEAVAVEKRGGKPGRRPGRGGRKPTGDSDLSREDRLKAKICDDDTDCQAAFDAWVVSTAYTDPQAAVESTKQAACQAKIDMANAIKQFKCDNDDDTTNDGDQCELATYDKCTPDEDEE